MNKLLVDYRYSHHGKNCLDGKYRILSKVVLVKNIFSDGNSIHEFGYSE